MPSNYLNEYTSRVLAVSREDVMRVANKYLMPAKMTYLIVGDRSRIEDGIRGLKLGRLELMSIEQVLGPPPEVN